MSGSVIVGILTLLVAAAAATGLWYAWRTWLQLCPHCGWIVRRVQHRWLRCPRCHKQYARPHRLRH